MRRYCQIHLHEKIALRILISRLKEMQYLICRNNQVIPAGIPCTIGKVSVRLCEFPHYVSVSVSVSVYVCVCLCLCVCVCVRQCPAPRVPHLLHLDLGGDRPSSAGQHRPKICRPQPLLSEPPHREHPPVSLKLDLASDGRLRLVRVRDLVRGLSEGALVRELSARSSLPSLVFLARVRPAVQRVRSGKTV